MRQVICDRCGEVVPKADEAKTRDVALLAPDDAEDDGNIDNYGEICPACITSFRAWLKPPRAAAPSDRRNGDG